jgi:DNA-binding NarL/FixJ family response regulator
MRSLNSIYTARIEETTSSVINHAKSDFCQIPILEEVYFLDPLNILNMAPIRVLLVDDNPEFLDATERFLSTDSWLEIIGHTLSGEEALERTTSMKPDLVLMDLAMPKMNGLETTRHIKAMPGAPRVILLTLYDNYEYRSASEAVHADGFVAKSDLGVQLLSLIHHLFEDEQSPGSQLPN